MVGPSLKMHQQLCISTIIYLIISGNQLISAPALAQSEPAATELSTPEIIPTTTYYANLEQLALDNSADDSFWLNIDGQKTLTLKYLARGKVSRGNLILLHAQGEHAGHFRFSHPLARQLSQLGWHVYAPSLPREDYPTQLKEEINDSTNNLTAQASKGEKSPNESKEDENASDSQNNQQETEQTSQTSITRSFFTDQLAYQQFITRLLDELKSTIEPSTEDYILIANQNSAYWILEPLKTNNWLTHVVLIEPQLPKNQVADLEQAFLSQNLPVFIFVENNKSSIPFVNAFEKQLWRSPSQRFNQGVYSNQGILTEDFQIAKQISGWVKALKKNQ